MQNLNILETRLCVYSKALPPPPSPTKETSSPVTQTWFSIHMFFNSQQWLTRQDVSISHNVRDDNGYKDLQQQQDPTLASLTQYILHRRQAAVQKK